MAYSRTLAQLRTSFLIRGQWENSADITPAVANEMINDALIEGYNLIVERWDDYYTQVGTPFVTVVGTGTYALPTDFEKLRKVEVLMSGLAADPNARWSPIFPVSIDDTHRHRSTAPQCMRYRIAAVAGAASLILVPPPTSVSTIRVFYLPHATQLVADSDVVVFDTPHEQKLVLHIALRDAYQRQDLPTADIEGKIALLASQVRSASDHDAGEPFYLGDRTGSGYQDDY